MGTITKEIQENNKLIAEFMGYKLITPEMRKHLKTWNYSYWEKYIPKKHVLCEEKELKYHSSWDWLMSVVEKIESLGYKFIISGVNGGYNNIVEIPKLNIKNTFQPSKLECVYTVVIEFIKWYNKNK